VPPSGRPSSAGRPRPPADPWHSPSGSPAVLQQTNCDRAIAAESVPEPGHRTHPPPIGEPYPWVPGWRRVMPRARRPRMPLSTSTRQAKSREAVTAISATPPGTLKMRAPAHLSALAASRRGDGTDFPARRSPSAGCGGQGPPGRRSRGVRPAGAQPLLCQRASSIRHVAGRTHTKRHAGPGEIAMYRILGALAPACK
jgi:hypothetical protein